MSSRPGRIIILKTLSPADKLRLSPAELETLERLEAEEARIRHPAFQAKMFLESEANREFPSLPTWEEYKAERDGTPPPTEEQKAALALERKARLEQQVEEGRQAAERLATFVMKALERQQHPAAN